LRNVARPGKRTRAFVDVSKGDRVDCLADVYERLVRRWHYAADPIDTVDWLISAEDLLADAKSFGDCEDFAGLMAAALQAFPDPWPCRIVVVSRGPQRHAFTEVKMGSDLADAKPMLEQLASRWNCDLLTLPITKDQDESLWMRLDMDGPPIPGRIRRELAVYLDSARIDFYEPGNEKD
jgi:hypothetical protein